MRRVLESRGFVSVLAILLLCAVTVVAYVVFFDPLRKTQSYCAMMPDSIGLYAGSDVTMRGVRVGRVTALAPRGPKVRVEFEVDAAHPVQADAAATTVSDTVVADRELAVLNTGRDVNPWNPATCITRTLTPQSISRTLDAMARLSEQILGPESGGRDSLGRAITGMDKATRGTGAQINSIVVRLGQALEAPDAAIGHLAGSVDAITSLSDAITTHWGDITSMLSRMGPVLDQVNNELFTETVLILDGFARALPLFNDITTLFSDPIFATLDAAVPLVRFLSANVGSLREIIAMMPALAGAFVTVTDPGSGRTGLTYAPPQVAIPHGDAEQLCALVNAASPGLCTGAGDGIARTRLVQLVLGSVGVR
ncbi:MlaD family protein [Nocardia bovistercoris]|nr:MlaD family protein [Nocardia bovistercoris]